MPSWYPGRPYKPVDAKDADKTDIPKSRELKSKLDEWLTGNVVEPMSKAGYPNVGAGVAAVPSTIAEFLTPESPYELAPGMAGVGKMQRKGEALAKKIYNKYKELPIDEVEKALEKVKRISESIFMDNPKWGEYDAAELALHSIINSKKRGMDVGAIPISGMLKPGKFELDEIDRIKKYNKGEFNYSRNYPNSSLFNPSKSYEEAKISKKDTENIIKDLSKSNSIVDRALFGKPTKPYLRPKGYANQKKQVKPTAPATKQMSREEYDKMLQGRTDPNYYDKLRESFNNTEQELSPLERFLKERDE